MDNGIQNASSKSKHLQGDTQRLFQQTSLYTCFIKTAFEYKTFNNVLKFYSRKLLEYRYSFSIARSFFHRTTDSNGGVPLAWRYLDIRQFLTIVIIRFRPVDRTITPARKGIFSIDNNVFYEYTKVRIPSMMLRFLVKMFEREAR